MRIAVVSDTHRDKDTMNRISELIENADMLIHLGDNVDDAETLEEIFKKKTISVRGNCDFRTRVPEELVEEIDGIRVLVTHGHNYNVKNNLLQLLYRAEELNVDMVLFGHTHIPEITFQSGIWLINPGSASLPRNGGKTIVFIELKGGEISPSIEKI